MFSSFLQLIKESIEFVSEFRHSDWWRKCRIFQNIILSERDGGEEDSKDESEDEKKLTLQELREKNAELRLVCEELTRELASALQERINLRAKLLLLTWCDCYSFIIHSIEVMRCHVSSTHCKHMYLTCYASLEFLYFPTKYSFIFIIIIVDRQMQQGTKFTKKDTIRI